MAAQRLGLVSLEWIQIPSGEFDLNPLRVDGKENVWIKKYPDTSGYVRVDAIQESYNLVPNDPIETIGSTLNWLPMTAFVEHNGGIIDHRSHAHNVSSCERKYTSRGWINISYYTLRFVV